MVWTNGMGILWGSDYIPYTLGGARALWCPADKVDDFNGHDVYRSLGGSTDYTNGNCDIARMAKDLGFLKSSWCRRQSRRTWSFG